MSRATKKADPTAGMDDGTALTALLRRSYELLIERAFADAVQDGVEALFDLEMVEVQQVLDRLATDVRRVAETTKQEIRDLVSKQASEGWSVQELAAAIQERGIVASATRAATISRSETGTAYNLGSVAAYRAGGITHVTVLDGDEDEPCASANGATWTLEEAEQNPLGHPNCTRSYAPIVEVDE